MSVKTLLCWSRTGGTVKKNMPTLIYKLKEVSEELKIPYHDLRVLVRWIIFKGKNRENYRLFRNQINKVKKILNI